MSAFGIRYLLFLALNLFIKPNVKMTIYFLSITFFEIMIPIIIETIQIIMLKKKYNSNDISNKGLYAKRTINVHAKVEITNIIKNR